MARARWLAVLVALVACGDDDGARDDAGRTRDGPVRDDAAASTDAAPPVCSHAPVAGTDLVLEPVAEGLAEPLFVTGPPGDSRLFVVERLGLIRIVRDGAVEAQPFLDIGDRMVTDDGEQGLLGLAFHPDWPESGRFFVYYTAPGGTPYTDRVSEFSVSTGDPDRADPDSERIVIEADDPHPRHNGGMIAFGPDRDLYIGMGDGGGAGDPGDDAQDTTNILGDMLRIDVDGPAPYGIPSDNPHVGEGGGVREEIWLSGLRNPWRWSFDRATGEMYIADVGQASREEVSLIPAGQGGLNLGWNDMEGDICYDNPDCLTVGYFAPLVAYANEAGPPCRAVIGGYTYRGACYPDIVGTYFYADFCTADMWSLRAVDGELVAGPDPIRDDLDPEHVLATMASFGEDAAGEIYVVNKRDGTIHHIAARP